jgi:serine/threonine protein kinase
MSQDFIQYPCAIDTDSEDEYEDTLSMMSTTTITTTDAVMQGSGLVRRRSSVRSKLSITSLQKNAEDLLITDYSKDLTQRTINDFKQITILGFGSFGLVHLVKDIHTGQYYAKKSIKKARISVDKTMLKNQKNERDILALVNHPGIVKLFYAFHDDEQINLILEFIQGGELFTQMHIFHHNEIRTAYYLAEIADALHHLHSVGVVYRDLKPENCMLDAEGHVILTDFGLSTQEEKCKSILGTPQYCAPEVLMGSEYSYKADWWSFGILMFDMITGDLPFHGNDRRSLIRTLMKRNALIPEYFSKSAKDLIKKLLRRKPEHRFDFDDDFDALKNHEFFRCVTWDKLRTTKAPFTPAVGPIEEVPNFNPKKVEREYHSKSRLQHGYVDNSFFKGFSFVADQAILESYNNK